MSTIGLLWFFNKRNCVTILTFFASNLETWEIQTHCVALLTGRYIHVDRPAFTWLAMLMTGAKKVPGHQQQSYWLGRHGRDSSVTWGRVYSYPFLLWWLWEYVYLIFNIIIKSEVWPISPLFRVRSWNNGISHQLHCMFSIKPHCICFVMIWMRKFYLESIKLVAKFSCQSTITTIFEAHV